MSKLLQTLLVLVLVLAVHTTCLNVKCNKAALKKCQKYGGGDACYKKHKCTAPAGVRVRNAGRTVRTNVRRVLKPRGRTSSTRTSTTASKCNKAALKKCQKHGGGDACYKKHNCRASVGARVRNTGRAIRDTARRVGSAVRRTATRAVRSVRNALKPRTRPSAQPTRSTTTPRSRGSRTGPCNMPALKVCLTFKGGKACYPKHGCNKAEHEKEATKPTASTRPTTSVSTAPTTPARNTPTPSSATPRSATPSSATPSSGCQRLIYHHKVTAAFEAKVRKICAFLGIPDPNLLMACMAFETGGSFSPSQKNQAGSGATGLIQFMPATARGLGTSTAKLARMTQVQQLDWVQKYFTPHKNKLKSLSDLYMAILWPAAVGKSDSYALFKLPSKAYAQNKGLDVNKDGVVSKGEAASKPNKYLKDGIAALDDGRCKRSETSSATQPTGSTATTARNCFFATPCDGVYTSPWGTRWGKWHWGIDIAKQGNVPIYAIADGTVEDTVTGCKTGHQTCGGSAGNQVRIAHADGWRSQYFHLYPGSVAVKKGQKVKQGQKIGRMGHTGHSTGQHLHMEIAKGALYPRRATNYINPCTGRTKAGKNTGKKIFCPSVNGAVKAKTCPSGSQSSQQQTRGCSMAKLRACLRHKGGKACYKKHGCNKAQHEKEATAKPPAQSSTCGSLKNTGASKPKGTAVRWNPIAQFINDKLKKCHPKHVSCSTYMAGSGDHPGNALDCFPGRSGVKPAAGSAAKKKGDLVAKWLKDNAKALKVKYIIWWRRIWSVARSAEGWRECAGPKATCYGGSNPTQAHYDHLHISTY